VRRPFAGRSLTDRFHQTSKLVHPSKPAENSTSRPTLGGKAAHEGRGAADRCQYRQAAGAIAASYLKLLAKPPPPPHICDDKVHSFLRTLLAASHDVGPGKRQDRNIQALKHTHTPAVFAGLLWLLMKFVAVGFHYDERPVAIQKRYDNGQIDQTHAFNRPLGHEDKQSAVYFAVS
jgi:hypothetical protein